MELIFLKQVKNIHHIPLGEQLVGRKTVILLTMSLTYSVNKLGQYAAYQHLHTKNYEQRSCSNVSWVERKVRVIFSPESFLKSKIFTKKSLKNELLGRLSPP